ncbi:MAG: histidine phosphatase family protein [Lachnospiraceae bacterium]|nr:histidine phosphatase family protein [Lachnospiraceae bacterium]
MELIWIRHAATKGNLEKRYISLTDEKLCPEGISALLEKKVEKVYPEVDRVYSTYLNRCMETAKLLYPLQGLHILEGLEEMHFGVFEGKNFQELDGNEDYQKWIDSDAYAGMPEGESRGEFLERITRETYEFLKVCKGNKIAMVVHGGTIMAALTYLDGSGPYFSYACDNGAGFRTVIPDMTIDRLRNGNLGIEDLHGCVTKIERLF